MFQQTNEGIIVQVKVTPKALNSSICGWKNGELIVRLAAIPEKGEANEELIRILAAALGIGKSNLQLVQGKKSRHKRICINGFSLEQILQKLPEILQKESEIG